VCASVQTTFRVADILLADPLDGGSFIPRRTREHVMSIGTILLIVLILILVGVLPTWPHARSWGYGPSGIVGVILVIVIVLFLLGRL
jgi:uncharacterized protein DUF3309